ncbi:glycerophosphodiester phosphodiesterase [Enterococcus sp. S22(2020)]|uniref:glycerophosphodiester phosphodiesterase n=1 Tax=Enterococcus sp. S22(2020) TaxID=2759151 RepID=UPI001CE17D17|nr:glycerophosphodiester phosphodiesterase [Enterococcus sp. S22(2020)]
MSATGGIVVTKIIAHRGSKGTNPENTLIAFKEAVRVGADGIELDVHLSKDKQLVVIHDETVDRTTNGSGFVADLTLAELKQLDAGLWFKPFPVEQKIPTLEEVLQLLEEEKFYGLLNIEIKTDQIQYEGIESQLVQLMQSRSWMFDYMYSSFHYPSLEKVWTLEKNRSIALIFKASERKKDQAVKSSFIEGIHPNIEWVLEHIKELSDFPKAIRPWTVNDKEKMKRCIESRLSGIHTDFPEIALQVRKEVQAKG